MPTTPAPMVLHITDWRLYYEVNKDGGELRAGQRPRQGPLRYVRWHIGGPQGNHLAFAEAADAVSATFGDDRWPVAWGLFAKLLEFAADHSADLRGYLVSKGGKPLSRRMMARLTMFTEDQIEAGLEALLHPDVGWLEKVPSPTLAAGRRPSAKKAEKHVSRAQPNRTEPNPTQHNTTEPNASPTNAEPPTQHPPANNVGSDVFSLEGRNGSVSGSAMPDPADPMFSRRFALRAGLAIGLSQTRQGAKQYQADCAALLRLAKALQAGELGQPPPLEEVMSKMQELGSDRSVRKPMAALTQWAKTRAAEAEETP